MRIMTSNQWKCDENRPAWQAMGLDCSAPVRSEGLLRAYKQIGADILAIQESSHLMEQLILNGMKQCRIRDGEEASYQLITGGDTPLFYRADKLYPVETGHFMYPEKIPGYDGSFNNGRTKSYAYGVFEDLKTGEYIAVLTTHLWWKSSKPESPLYQPGSSPARVYQISTALDKMEEVTARWHCPGLVMGDLNAGMGSECMNTVYARGWVETHEVCVGETDQTKGHHFCNGDGFRRDPLGRWEDALDHILVKKDSGITVTACKRLNDEWFDCISDHYPLYVDIDR